MISAAQSAKIKSIAYKCAIYTVALFILAIAQTVFFSKINVLSATPDLLLAAIVLLCMKEDHRVCSICAIVSGVFYCALGAAEHPVYIIFSFLCGYILWIIAERSFGRGFKSYLALSALTFCIKGLFNLAYLSLFSSSFPLIRILMSIALPEIISSMVFCAVPYVIFSTLHKLINKKSSKRKEPRKNEL